MKSYFLRAWLICGTLDIGWAAINTLIGGGSVAGMLRFVAAGPFPDGAATGALGGAVLGLAVHFALMAVMVATYGLLTAQGLIAKLGPWWLTGALYGLALYLIMYWVVMPVRWPSIHPGANPVSMAKAIFAHVALVGLPMAYFARRLIGKGDPDMSDDLVLSVTNYIDAPPGNRPGGLARPVEEWWCPKPWRAEIVAQEWHAGGRAAQIMHGPNGEAVPNEGI